MSQPSFGADGFRTEQELRRWSADVAAKAERYQEMQTEVAGVAVTESSRDDVVSVTVDATGTVTDLRISDRSRELPGAELADLVLATMRRAQARITDRVAEVMQRTVGDDPGTVAAVVDSYRRRFPEPEPEPERPNAVTVEEMRLGRDLDGDDERHPDQSHQTRPRRSTRDDDDEEPWGGPFLS
ncbi:YbaB/EbfC family nucleoid-associated protein [Actinokineospora enzanensis]|uniref:YbaB/EbfC family nucleoid-associated protein n=1 Tax=Actinokineospora enzanensis TaxID=155975 RepID=UPI00039F85F0|nr:YbaB/EbfC family nucleoid-associated protein [Actinokineospora enzanensis]